METTTALTEEFIAALCIRFQRASSHLGLRLPAGGEFQLLIDLENTLSYNDTRVLEGQALLKPGGIRQPFEDSILEGFFDADGYYPRNWFFENCPKGINSDMSDRLWQLGIRLNAYVLGSASLVAKSRLRQISRAMGEGALTRIQQRAILRVVTADFSGLTLELWR